MPKMFSYEEFSKEEIGEMYEFYQEDTPPLNDNYKCPECGESCEACYAPIPKKFRSPNHSLMAKTLGQACKFCLDKYVVLDSKGKPKGVMVNNVLTLSIV